MDIYPIIPGQKVSDRNFIPPHASAGHPPTAGKPAAEDNRDDLIDFSKSEAPKASADGTRTGSNDVSAMLQATGKEAEEGPLIDFAGDVKKNLPEPGQKPQNPAAMTRSETGGSNDDFFDARE